MSDDRPPLLSIQERVRNALAREILLAHLSGHGKTVPLIENVRSADALVCGVFDLADAFFEERKRRYIE